MSVYFNATYLKGLVLYLIMNNFVDFWNGLGYNGYLLVLLIVLFLSHVVVLICRGMILVSKRKQPLAESQEGVSVIITCSNRAELLKENLEAFLKQDYPQFEVIVVDECSEDETHDVLSDLQQVYPHLKTSRIFPGTKFRRTKKIAINIGVLAARYDILLFSEINCVPESPNWIRSMSSYFTPETAVVIGYSNYGIKDEVLSIRRFFRFLWFWKTFVLIKRKLFINGNGTNMGYRRKYYLEERGYTGNTQEYIGFDTDMVKKISRKGQVRVVKERDTRMIIKDDSHKDWEDDCSYYFATKHRWPSHVRMLSNADFVLESAFYLLSFYFIFSGVLHKYVAILVMLTFLMDLIVINICLKHLEQKKLFLTSFTINALGFLYKWYYNIYSIFTAKKWR